MYAAVNPAGTDGLSLFSDFTRSLEYGQFKSSPRRTSSVSLFGLGGLFGGIGQLLKYLTVSSSIEDRAPWTVMARGSRTRDSIFSNLALEQNVKSSQLRFRMSDPDRAAAAPYLHAFAYLESRKVSTANAQLLDLLHQQLNVHPESAQAEAERLLRARLVCPLGGKYQVLTKSVAPRWSSTAWTSDSVYELREVPADYRFPFLEWLHGLDLAFNLTPTTLTAEVDLDVNGNGVDQVVAVTSHLEDTRDRHGTDFSVRRRVSSRGSTASNVRLVLDPADLRPGDTIVILKNQAELKIGRRTLARLSKNETFRIVEVRGDWIGILETRRGKMLRGWVHIEDVGAPGN
jgi:hypothetical protein